MLAALVLLGAGCKEETKEDNTGDSKVPVTVAQSEKKRYAPHLEYTGTAFASREANLGTTLPGRVEKVHYPTGTQVKKGDLLVELSAELYAQAMVEVETLKKDFERIERLREKGSVSEQDYDHVKAKYEAAKANARMMKKNTEIRAPFSGTIVDYLVEEGENYLFSPNLKPGYSMTSGIVQLMNLDYLIVKVDVNEKDLSKVKTGQKAEIVFDAYPHKKIAGEVVRIDHALSTTTRTAKAEVRIKNAEQLFKPGMYASVSLVLPEIESVFVPLKAIYRQPGTANDYVFVVQGGKASRVAIDRRYTMDDLAAVDGLEGGKTIVLAGKNKLNEGSLVEVKK